MAKQGIVTQQYQFLTPTDTDVPADGTFSFELMTTFALGDGTRIPRGTLTMATTDGALAAFLDVPDAPAFSARYKVTTPDGETAKFYISYAGAEPLQLADLMASSSGTLMPSLWAGLVAHEDSVATTETPGHVQPDGTTITIDAEGVISSVGGGGGSSNHAALSNLSYAESMHTGFASSTDLASAIAALDDADEALLTNVNTRALDSALTAHAGATNNPHATTAAQVGADPTGTAAAAVGVHAARTDNPHSVTAAQVGALTQSQADALYASLAILAGYAQLAAAQTFTKAQTVQGEAADEATGIFYVKDSAGNTILTVRKSTGYADGRLLLNAGNVSNVPGLRINAMPEGICEKRDWTSGGSLELNKDGNGIMQIATNNVRREKVNGSAFSSAGRPSFSIEDEGRAAIDTLEVYPGDSANTSRDTAVRRKTSTGDALAGRRNAYFYDMTHATRKAAHALMAIDYAAERTFIEGRADGTQALVGFLGAAPVARPTITGSRGGNAALASLLTALASLGLITDTTTA